MKKILAMTLATAAVVGAYGAGFGIYEAGTRGASMGGAVVGDTGDASSNYYNPANNAFATNIQVSAGVTAIYPYCDHTVDHRTQTRMSTNWFWVPTFYLTIPLPGDFALGWGNYTEYGLGTHYSHDWDLAGDTQKTTMRQVTLSPTLSYKVTDRWSVAAGLRASWIQFSNHKKPYFRDSYNYDTQYGTLSAPDAYHLHSKLKGDDWGMGWLAGTTFKATDDLSFGLVYRSQIKHKIKGNFDLKGDVSGTLGGTLYNVPYGGTILPEVDGATALKAMGGSPEFSQKQRAHLPASAKLTLPRSITGGVNYNVTPRYRVGASVTWTEWSSVNTIRFRIPHYGYSQPLKWNDVWRFGVGMEYDLLDWLAVRLGYAYDMDPSSKHHGTTMIPAGDRHIISTGLGFKITENLFVDFGYTFIRMNNDDRIITVKTPEGEKKHYRWSTRNGFSHLPSLSLRYYF